MAAPPILYGATGFTGRLIAHAAAERGIELVLAGRSRETLEELAGELRMPARVFSLDRTDEVVDGIRGAPALLNCAGPFLHTWKQLVTACIGARVPYLDITGEIEVFEGIALLDEDALEAGVPLLPGVGFDVVPSDCLAAWLKFRMPEARQLKLGILGTGRLSRGTAATMVEHVGRGGAVRRAGRIVREPVGRSRREIDFGRGPRPTVTIPWGDVATAWHSTKIPDIEVYATAGAPALLMARASGVLGPVLRRRLVKRVIRRAIQGSPSGPDAVELASGSSVVWGRVEDELGRGMEARVTGPNGYRITVDAALHILTQVVQGNVPPGFQTPSTAFGPDLVLELGMEREEMEPG